MPTLLPDDEISEIMSFNIKQHALFNVVLEWSKKYVKYKGVNIQPIHFF